MFDQPIRPRFWHRHPWVSAAAMVILVWLLIDGWYATLAVIGVLALLIAVTRHRRAVARRNAGLRARADYEHRLSLAGDPRGVFGRYPPVQPGWFPDPQHGNGLRYFDGAVWTSYARPR